MQCKEIKAFGRKLLVLVKAKSKSSVKNCFFKTKQHFEKFFEGLVIISFKQRETPLNVSLLRRQKKMEM